MKYFEVIQRVTAKHIVAAEDEQFLRRALCLKDGENMVGTILVGECVDPSISRETVSVTEVSLDQVKQISPASAQLFEGDLHESVL